ncbi:nucleotidyl transferase AbiEii/AbiGii toxin family protein [Murdochiella vaginalis]|uniref:nucleotidyl transferase AbiEii/AbiGii toxin family protein n=1 Tax=Murdochiella vaginalis TaxID=1852373 RepID=UPI0008FEA29E|nr:nucleotidyl transferase AbiEii/AbiGii toxin family protein [Murdochiella vaginalis]
MDIRKIGQEDLRILIRNTAQKMGIHESVVEKDFWVCFVLNDLFHESPWQKALTFKGGTSLSKCFSIIERFSEDVDLILDWRTLGYGLNEPWEERSNTKQDKFNHEINTKTETFLADIFAPQFLEALKDKAGEGLTVRIDQADPQTVLFEYPKLFSSSYLSEVVRLEIGALAAWTPSEEVSIQPYVADAYPEVLPEAAFTVQTVSPERTFWEKATILHQEAHRPEDLAMPARYARHYYDLYRISLSKYKDKAIANPDLLQKVAAFKRKFYPRKWARYEEATVEKIRLVPDAYRYPALKKDYEAMQEMFFHEVPKFADLIEALRQLEEEIHQSQK